MPRQQIKRSKSLLSRTLSKLFSIFNWFGQQIRKPESGASEPCLPVTKGINAFDNATPLDQLEAPQKASRRITSSTLDTERESVSQLSRSC